MSLKSKNCCGYYLGNFEKHLGDFLNLHLVTLTVTDSPMTEPSKLEVLYALKQ